MNLPPLPPAVAALFPPAETRRHIDSWLTEELERARTALRAGPVTPTIDMEKLRRELQRMDFTGPQPLESLLRWTVERLTHGIVHMGNPRYFGLFNPGPTFPAQCAERITSLFNPQLASSASSPVPVEIEAQVIRAVAQRAGFADTATGHFTTGGSEANFTALLCALTAAHRDFARDGVRALAGPPIFYTSRDCHIAWLKIAHQAGVGRAALRLIDTDGHGRLDPNALQRAISEDRARGAVPLMIVATAGTTGGGMIDPLPACAAIAAGERLWLHVDAAWGGAALASEHLRPLLRGMDRADSFTLDAHKWFATTMGCGMFITCHGDVLSQTFHAAAGFMPSGLSALDPYLNSMQWSRRFAGLRLFLALGTAGWPGLGEHVERSVTVIARIKGLLLAAGWSVLNDSPLAVLNAVPPVALGDVRALVRRVVTSGRAWVAACTYEGIDVVRICATHGETTEQDIDELVAVLNCPG